MLIDPEQTRSTRERVLHTLLTSQRCTINELAAAVDINPISVRHHISRLEAEGLVHSEEERHGVGRPRRVYFLTEHGLELFPTRYLRLTLRLLDTLKEALSPATVENLFNQMAQDLAAEYQLGTKDLTIEERMNLVKGLLSAEGFTVDWEQKGDEFLIHEANCPYFHIGQNHPEVCAVDQALISAVLSMPSERVRCMLDGDSHCTYAVSGISEENEENSQPVETQEA
jgi:predicted ArsR family transcriptional regulator